jgi:hypothetical protein
MISSFSSYVPKRITLLNTEICFPNNNQKHKIIKERKTEEEKN